jgi:hypothetical protein
MGREDEQNAPADQVSDVLHLFDLGVAKQQSRSSRAGGGRGGSWEWVK